MPRHRPSRPPSPASPRGNAEELLRRLATLKLAPVSDDLRQEVRKALNSPMNFFVAKAADLAREKGLRELIPDLVAAFERYTGDTPIDDRGCEAKVAIIHALHELDHDDAAVFIKGTKIKQLEGGWGENQDVDTAVPLRAASAIGLARQRHRTVLNDLTPLLVDAAAKVRAAAAQAIGAAGRPEGQLLLRLKVLMGDEEPDVTMECFSSLLILGREDSLEFVGEYLKSGAPRAAESGGRGRLREMLEQRGHEIADDEDSGDAIREAAALALGGSRLSGAFELLRGQWSPTMMGHFAEVLLVSMAMLRNDAAMDFLISLIREGSIASATMAIGALKVAKGDSRMRQRVEATVKERGEPGLEAVMRRELG